MSYTRRIAHNTIIQIIGKAISTVIGVVVIAMLTRYLGAAGFGQYSVVMAFLQLFGILVDMGLYMVMVKRIAEPGADEEAIAGNVFTLRLLSAIAFLGLAPLVALFFPYDPIIKWGILVTTFSFFGITLNQVLIGLFQKHLRMDKVVIAELVGRVVLVGGTAAVIALQLNLLWILGVVSVSSLMNFLFTFIFSRRFVRIRLRFNWPIWRAVITDSWPIALSIGFNLLYFKTDILILQFFHGNEVAGMYGAANKVLEVLVTFPAVFAGLVLPLLTAAWTAGDRERFTRMMRKSFDAMAVVAVPLIVGTIFLARPIMQLVAPEFSASPVILQLLIVATGIIFIGNVFGNSVIVLNRQRTMLWGYGVTATVALIGYFWLVPLFSYMGAAVIRIVAELLITLNGLLIVGLVARAWPSLWSFLRITAASGLMGVALYLLRDWPFVVAALVAAVFYGILIIAFRVVTRETIKEIISIRRNT